MSCRCTDPGCVLPPAPIVDLHVCDYCGERWRNPISAALCCDAVSNDATDDLDLDGSPIRSVN